MVLQAQVARSRVILPGNVEFVRGAVGTFVGFGEIVEVHRRDRLAVQLDADRIVVTGDNHVVPFSRWLHCVFAGLDQIVDGSGVVVTGSRGVSSWNKLTLMIRKRVGVRVPIRYSEAFKREVVREVEQAELTYAQAHMKYGIKGQVTVQRWVRQYGNGSRGKVMRVEQPEEVTELQRLRRRVRSLESALADANINLAVERAYTRMACERAGIKDVEGFKKKAAGPPPTQR